MKQLASCLILKENKILLVKRFKEDFWKLPGKILMENEDPEMGAKDGTLKETGLPVDIVQIFNEYQYKSTNNSDDTINNIVYEASTTKTEPVEKTNEEIEKVAYFEMNEISKIKISPNLKLVIDDLGK